MPVPSTIANAAASYQQNAQILDKSFDGLTPEEWQARPNGSTNPMLWIAGHIVWSRATTLQFLGAPWSRPWLPLFARGAKLLEPSEYPTTEEVLAAWSEVKASLSSAMEGATEEALAAPGPEKIPSLDGKMSGLVGFLAFHETYHVGQAAYLRRYLGHGQVLG
jgi:uncharacterized damage-inducible protein DinB